MTLLRPLFLLALVVLPILWLLARRRRARRDVAVSGLLLWRRLSLEPDPPVETRRRTDRLLLLRLAAAAAAAIGMAGPALEGPGPALVVPVLLDDSPSMKAFRSQADAALAAIAAAAPRGAELRVRRSPGLADLPSVLAGAVGDVVVVTDHDPGDLPEGGRVRTWLVGRPVENVGFVSGWIAGEEAEPRYGAVVASFAEKAVTRTVYGPGGASEIVLDPGERRLLEGPAPEGRAELRLEPADPFPFDDRLGMRLAAATRPALAWRGPDEPHVRIALAAAGVRFEPEADSEVTYRAAPGPRTVLAVAPPGARRPAARGGAVSTGGLPAEAAPGPEVTLGPVGPAGGGTSLLRDAVGALATRDEGVVVVGLDPGDPASGWARDPSFPVFFAEVARLLGARPERTEYRVGAPDPAESATRPAARRPDLGGLAPSRAGGAGEPRDLSPWPLLLAAALLAIHLLLEARDRRPVLSS